MIPCQIVLTEVKVLYILQVKVLYIHSACACKSMQYNQCDRHTLFSVNHTNVFTVTYTNQLDITINKIKLQTTQINNKHYNVIQ